MPAPLQSILHSRKFWVLVAAVVTAAGGLAAGQITFEQFLQAALVAAVTYAGATAIEDHGAKSGASVTITGGAEEPPAAQ